MVEDDSVFGDMFLRGELLLPDEDICADMFELTQELTEANGIPAYEISNHARLGFECQHNVGYWRYYDYVGIGPGAHGRLAVGDKKFALVQEMNPQKWLRSIISNKHILEAESELSEIEQAKEAVLVGLRMSDGIICDNLPLLLEEIVEEKAFKQLLKMEYISYKDGVLSTTKAGRARLNSLLLYIVK
jgi:oxygen-independent coproporphyrinogen-3 oxidase